MYKRFLSLVLLAFVAFGVVTCSSNDTLPDKDVKSKQQGAPEQSLVVWWQQGFYPEETDAIRSIITAWEKQNNVKAELTFYSDKDIARETKNAIESGKTPDILFNPSIDLSLIPRLAWEGKLADLTDIVEPLKDSISPNALPAVSYMNPKLGKRSYYALPIALQSSHIHYWRDMLTEVGLKDTAIPRTWGDFWKFWGSVQSAERAKGKKDFYALGLPMSSTAGDTSFLFEQFLQAYGVELVDKGGKLVANENVIAKVAAALEEYSGFYKNGFVPPSALEWANPGNNVAFLSRNVAMVPNPSLSIPGSQRQDKETYSKKMSTLEWPLGVNGQPQSYLAGVKQVIVFEASPNQKLSKDLLSYIVKPSNLGRYLKESQGRFFPAMPKLLEDPFWSDPADPHISVAQKQYLKWIPFPQARNPAYSKADKIWGDALIGIIKENISPRQSAEKAMEKLKAIFAEWK